MIILVMTGGKIMKLGILGTGMIVKDLMTTYQKLNVEKTYILCYNTWVLGCRQAG